MAKCISSRSKPMCKNHRAWFWQNATGLPPISHFQTPLHFSTDCSFHIVQNQPGSKLVLADLCHILAKQIRARSKPVCKNHQARFWPKLPSRSRSNVNRIRHVYWIPDVACHLPLSCSLHCHTCALIGGKSSCGSLGTFSGKGDCG